MNACGQVEDKRLFRQAAEEKVFEPRLPGLTRAVIISLALATVYAQFWVLGFRYLRESQLERHRDVIENRASNPWQYRVLSDWCLEPLLQLWNCLTDRSSVVPFIAFRIFQNLLIFLLAAGFYRRLGLRPDQVLLGLVLVGWGTSYAFYQSDLHFSSYSEIIFYLTAAILISDRRDGWIPAVTFLAALNRETAGLIPFAYLASRIAWGKGRPSLKRKFLWIFALSVVLYFAVFFSLRFGFGWRSFSKEWGSPGIGRCISNLKDPLTWQYVLLTVNLLPLFCVLSFKSWPPLLKRLSWGILPIWLLIHFYTKRYTCETRFLLVPLVLIFSPGAVLVVKRGSLPFCAPSRMGAESKESRH